MFPVALYLFKQMISRVFNLLFNSLVGLLNNKTEKSKATT